MNDLPYLTLAYYYVDDVYPGTYITNAYGCKNDTCPNDFGCPADYFTFHPNGTFYTLILQTDIDTPKPTSYFTSSQNFTQSNKFDQTNEFTPSDTFTQSDYFTCSSKFSDSNDFSPSFQFTISSPLEPQKTNTKQFTNSDEFTSSQKFTKSIEFSDSDSFKPTPTQSQIYNIITSTLTLM